MSSKALAYCAGTVVFGYGAYKLSNPSMGFKVPPPPPPQARKIVVLFGPPGAGKGTQAPRMQKYLGVPHLSTGDMLRAAIANKTAVGMQAKAAISAGKLVSDDIVLGIIGDRIQEADCSGGFMLDGFPRTLNQAKSLDGILKGTGEVVSKVIELDVPDEVLAARICGRWIHKKSGRSYHVTFAPPNSLKPGMRPSKANMKDDATGEALYQRPDDTEKALVRRLAEYHSLTTPVLTHYTAQGCVSTVNANQKQGEVAFEFGTVATTI